jgi:hypothetical protein
MSRKVGRWEGKSVEMKRADSIAGKCNDAQKSATVKDFNIAVASENIGPDPEFGDFDLICDA